MKLHEFTDRLYAMGGIEQEEKKSRILNESLNEMVQREDMREFMDDFIASMNTLNDKWNPGTWQLENAFEWYMDRCGDTEEDEEWLRSQEDIEESLTEATIDRKDIYPLYRKEREANAGKDTVYFSGHMNDDDVEDFRSDESKSLRPYSDQYKYLQKVKHDPDYEKFHMNNSVSPWDEMDLLTARSHAHQAQKNLLDTAREKHKKNESLELNESKQGLIDHLYEIINHAGITNEEIVDMMLGFMDESQLVEVIDELKLMCDIDD